MARSKVSSMGVLSDDWAAFGVERGEGTSILSLSGARGRANFGN